MAGAAVSILGVDACLCTRSPSSIKSSSIYSPASPKREVRVFFWCCNRDVGSMDANEYSYSLPALPSNRWPYFKIEVRSKLPSCSRSSSGGGWSSDLISGLISTSSSSSSAFFISWPSSWFGSKTSLLETIRPIALAAAALVSHDFDLRYGRIRPRRLKSSSGCCFWTSANCWAAVLRMMGVLPVSRSLRVVIGQLGGFSTVIGRELQGKYSRDEAIESKPKRLARQ